MIARVLLIGDELLGGTVSDRNVATIANGLGERGVPVVGVEIVRDEIEEIAAAFRRVVETCDVLVMTGGLGSTDDDVTREAVGQALGVAAAEHESALRQVTARLAERGLATSGDAARRMARLPAGCEPVTNPVGTAPGFRGRIGRCSFWALPGVPQEVIVMIPGLVADIATLRGGGLAAGFGWQRIVATTGVGEVRVAERLAESRFTVPPGVRLAFLPSAAGVRVRLAAPHGAPDEVLDRAESEIRRALGTWALPDAGLAESLVRLLAARGRTIATAESCTGGLLGARITDVPGSSSVYLGGIVAYSNRVKMERLGVPLDVLERHGAVSEPVAKSMAEGAIRELGSDLAVAVTGIAGPGGGTPAKPVGTVWIAAADASGEEALGFRVPGNREMVRERSVHKALELAYRRVEAEFARP